MTISEFIKKRPYLVWYVKNPEELPVESVIEHTLNYGNWDDVQKLIEIIGIEKMSTVFKKQTSGFRTNYDVKTKNYFNLYFGKYAK